METVFSNVVLQQEVKSYLLLGGLLVTGLVCPFTGKLHMGNSDRKLFASLF
ncbi:hypothetical protein ACFSTH_09830 [Paenibacillus yanchengensis]|uniref:Uncharacterized protein n=1 Tax=Paenibacillus yanchengensis TaxID=2035833 RepID=A0ABW4YIM2_9BACL